MKATRALLGAVGVGFGLWGVWLMRDFTAAQLTSIGIWLVGGVVLHDAVLAPLTVGVGVLSARTLPRHLQAVAGIAFLVWGTLSIAVGNVLLGQGGKADNDTLLGRPYVTSWIVLTVMLALAAGVIAWRRHRAVVARAEA